jgi:hypothetical protein
VLKFHGFPFAEMNQQINEPIRGTGSSRRDDPAFASICANRLCQVQKES